MVATASLNMLGRRGQAELAVLMAEAHRRLRPSQNALELGLGQDGDAEGTAIRPGVITNKSSAALWQVLTTAYNRLGFDTLDDPVLQQLVLARLIEPTSKADALRVLDEVGVGEYRDQVAARCFAHAGLQLAKPETCSRAHHFGQGL